MASVRFPESSATLAGGSKSGLIADGEQPSRNFFATRGFFAEQNKSTGVAGPMKADLEKRMQQALVAITVSTVTLMACVSLLLFR